MYQTLRYEKQENIGILTINRPEALNALNSTVIGDLEQAITEVEKDAELGALIITGEGRSFVAGADIGEQGAKEAALAHAGLTEGDVVSLSVKREYDDGRLEHGVKFWVDTTEYEYTVDGATGDIRKSEREPHPSASSADIGQDQAVSIALAHAGLSQSQVYRLEAEREWEDDHLEYQVEFKAGGMEYSYDIAASDGAILSFEREKD